jgi:hypothetical protein
MGIFHKESAAVPSVKYAVRGDLSGDWLWEGLGSPAITRPNNKHVTIQESDFSGRISNDTETIKAATGAGA